MLTKKFHDHFIQEFVPVPECFRCDMCGKDDGQMCALIKDEWTCYKCWILGPGRNWPKNLRKFGRNEEKDGKRSKG